MYACPINYAKYKTYFIKFMMCKKIYLIKETII